MFRNLGDDLASGKRQIDFVGHRRRWYAISLVIIMVALIGLLGRGLNYGIEFTGGAQYTMSLDRSVTQGDADRVREVLANSAIGAAQDPVVATAGSRSIQVQTQHLTDAESTKVSTLIVGASRGKQSELSQSEVGASWGQDVAHRAWLALIVFLGAVALVIGVYFREWRASVSAMVALLHDVIITVGIYALSGFSVSPATVTGFLTILGFSLYDTVVVFDRVKENTSTGNYARRANLAINQSLVRSLSTSLVALLPVLSLLAFSIVALGSSPLKDLSLALAVGMFSGAYSSLFIASPLLVALKTGRRRKTVKPPRNDAEGDRYAHVPAVH